VKLANSFTIDRPIEEVYAAFLDVDRIATCMPGSQLLGQPAPDTYEGEVKVKVGPLAVTYAGRFTILEAAEQERRLTMRATGRERRGAGDADAHIVAQLSEQADGTLVRIDTDLDIRGKVAQFGRGVIGEVTDSIMQTFAANIEEMLSGNRPSATPASAAPRPAGAGAPSFEAPTVGPSSAAAGDLDAWRLIVRPMLERHAGSLLSIGLTGLAAYLGARRGSRRRS
jgi:carbon monoxide dehydrogenase subunit G